MNFSSLNKFIAPIHREGWIFVAIAAGVTFLFALINAGLGWFAFVITLWIVYFFRDPQRVTPVREGLVISPADGTVVSIAEVIPQKELDLDKGKYLKISIFLNVFDCHVNRIPIDGTITKSHYFPGKFINATLDKASEDNERQLLTVQTDDGVKIGFVQIAGLIARRIVCDVKEGDKVKAGQHFGIIRFGSRMDVYIPKQTGAFVIEGQKVIAGETVLADLTSKEKNRIGEIR